MKTSMLHHVYAPFRLRPDRTRAGQLSEALGAATQPARVPPTYPIFLRGEGCGVDLFRDLDIPRQKALHGGQRYEWHSPLSFDEELEVTARVERITSKQGKRGTIWFADVSFEYRRVSDGQLTVREITRLIEQP